MKSPMEGELIGHLDGNATSIPAGNHTQPAEVLDIAVHLKAQANTDVSAWADETGNIVCSQATESKQPTLVQDSPSTYHLLFDGIDDFLLGDMTSPLLAGTRPHLWALAKFVDAGTSGSKYLCRAGLQSANNGFPAFQIYVSTVSSARVFVTLQNEPPSGYIVAYYQDWDVANTQKHVFESTRPDSTTGRFFIDGRSCDAIRAGSTTPTPTGELTQDHDRVSVGATATGTSPANVLIWDLIISRGLPTQAQRQGIMNYLQARAAFLA